MTHLIEKQIIKKGYIKAKGMAILNDIAVTETQHQVLSPKLSTQQAVDIFNNEFGEGWQLYRLPKPKALKK